jgi:GNAT superfamily N-acetyltransferase
LPPRISKEVRMRVERWLGGELPIAAVSVLREALRELGETEDEVFMSLDRAAIDSNLTFIASDDDRPLGVLLALPEPWIRSAFVLWIVVAPDARRKGVATALMDALATTQGIEQLTGMVDQEDSAAIGFWLGRGWTVRRPRPGRRRLLMGTDLPEVRSETT